MLQHSVSGTPRNAPHSTEISLLHARGNYARKQVFEHFGNIAVENGDKKLNVGAQGSTVQSAGKCGYGEQLIPDDAG